MLLFDHNNGFALRCSEQRWADLREDGWVFDRINRFYTTRDWRKAVHFVEYAETDELYDWLCDQRDELQREMSKSYAMFADADIPVPHITNNKGEVLDYLPYQKAGILYASERQDTLIADAPGLGKGQPLWAKVLTPTGWTTMGALKVGDPIVGSDGQTHYVTGVFDKGIMPIYRVEFTDGAATHVDGDHLWQVRRKAGKRRDGTLWQPDWEVMETRDLISRAYPSGIRSNKIEIPLVKPVTNTTVSLPLDAYLLGALLGDGGITQKTPHFSSVSKGVLHQVIARLPQGYVLRHSDRCSYRISPEVKGKRGPNPVTLALRQLGLMGLDSSSKFVPETYLHASLQDRVLLLNGLMDTDGYVAKDGTTQFSSNSLALRDAVVELAQSLGGTARKSQKISASGENHYITTLNLPFSPFLGNKERDDRWRPRNKYHPKRMFKSITAYGSEPVRCISVSAPDRLYVTDDYIVTHNTIQAIGFINLQDVRSGVVICPATLKLNWLKEMMKWLVDKDLSIGIAAGSEFPETDFVIINYDILDRNRDKLWAREWDVMICDEAQYLANEKSKRTQAVFGTYGMNWKTKEAERKTQNIEITDSAGKKRYKRVKCLPAYWRLMLTGTPMMKEPKDMWPMIRDFDPDGLGKNWSDFAMEYCGGVMTGFGMQTEGATNEAELNERLRRAFMIRRLKTAVLKDLPPKTRQVIVLPPEGLKRIIKTDRDKFTDALAMLSAANGDKVPDTKTPIEEMDPAFILDTLTRYLPQGFKSPEIDELDAGELAPGFAAYSEARKELALSKVPMAVEHIKRLLEAGEKVIVFAIHKDVIAELYKAFPQAARIIGGMSAKKVESEKQRFQGYPDGGIEPDPECNIILLNLKAGGVGHTLTEATVEVFLEMWSVPGDMEQAEDRAHRYGLEHNLLIQFLVVDGTIDATTIQTLIQRIEEIQRAVDGTDPFEGEDHGRS